MTKRRVIILDNNKTCLGEKLPCPVFNFPYAVNSDEFKTGDLFVQNPGELKLEFKQQLQELPRSSTPPRQFLVVKVASGIWLQETPNPVRHNSNISPLVFS